MVTLLQVLSTSLRVGVENLDLTVLGLLVDLLGGLDESLLDLLGRLGGGLNEVQTVLLSEGLSFLTSDLTGSLHIALVSDEDDNNVVGRALAAILEPRGEVLESLTTTCVIKRKRNKPRVRIEFRINTRGNKSQNVRNKRTE